MFSESLQDQLVRDYSHILVEEIAPDEALFFDELYDNRRRRISADKLLGSGIDQNIELLSPIIITAVSSVLAFIFKEILKKVKTRNKQMLKQEISDLFHGKSATHPPLSPEQLKSIKQTAQKQLESFGLSETKSRRIATAIIGALAVKNASK